MKRVMPGQKRVFALGVPGIHVLTDSKEDVDGRDEPGHDEEVRENLKSLVRKMLPSDMLTPFAMSGAICTGAGSLPDRNLTFRLHVRRARAAVKRGACVIHLGSQVDGFLDQTGCNVGVSGCFGEFEKCYRLTRKILPIDHSVFP